MESIKQYDIFWEDNIIKIGGRTKKLAKPLLHPESHLFKVWIKYLHHTELRHAGGWKVLLCAVLQQFFVV